MRYDVFNIWPNGLQYTHSILNIIRNDKNFKIVSMYKCPINTDMLTFLRGMYKCDAAPVEHMLVKTRYLLKSDNKETLLILVKNMNPILINKTQGKYHHIECKKMKEIKEIIRNKFNPRFSDGRRTEEHVIHGTDYESQVDYLLDFLGLPKKNYKDQRCKYPNIDPNYINLSDLKMNCLGVGILPLNESPHYLYVQGDKSSYINYWSKYFGKELTDDHSPEAFDNLINSLEGVEPIIVDGDVIIDGVHRASILLSRGHSKIRSRII